MKKKFFTKNRIVAIPWLLLSLGYIYYIQQIPPSTMKGDPGPTLFPNIAGFLMLALSLILFIFPGKESEKKWMDKQGMTRLGGLYLVYVLYVVGMALIGFTIPTALVLYTTCTMFSKSTGVQVPLYKRVIYAVLVTLVVWAFFHVLLKCQLPTGTFKALNILPLQ